MNKTWKRNVPVYDVPILTKPFLAMLAVGALGLALILYREVVGLGRTSGMNDIYAWGIWKTMNTMVLTGLGSGGFAIGIAAWIFGRNRLHAVLRTAILTSFLVYASGLTMLGIDVGRPWNFYWIAMPWHWNLHSPLLEVAFCMPLYTMVPLSLELLPPLLEWVYEHLPQYRWAVELVEGVLRRIYPWVFGLAFLLPAMHQSSLGALMLLAGSQVNLLWQTPFLPLLYVWAAAYMGFAFVGAVLMLAHLVWKRTLDLEVLQEMSRITAWLMGAWMVFRFVDLALRGRLPLAIGISLPCALFWTEAALLLTAIWMLAVSSRGHNIRLMFIGNIFASLGGMLYRFDPTTLVFWPRAGAFYFPSAMEMLIDIGVLSLTAAAFCLLVKATAILPASNKNWHEMEAARGMKAAGEAGKIKVAHFATADELK